MDDGTGGEDETEERGDVGYRTRKDKRCRERKKKWRVVREGKSRQENYDEARTSFLQSEKGKKIT